MLLLKLTLLKSTTKFTWSKEKKLHFPAQNSKAFSQFPEQKPLTPVQQCWEPWGTASLCCKGSPTLQSCPSTAWAWARQCYFTRAPLKHWEGEQHLAAGQDQLQGDRNWSMRTRAPGRGKIMVCAITSSGCWLQKSMVTEPTFFSRITYHRFPALLSLPFLILLHKQ